MRERIVSETEYQKEKMKKYSCPVCKRQYSCPTCGRPYKSAKHAAKCMVKARKKKERPYCPSCKKNFGTSAWAAVPKEVKDYIISVFQSFDQNP